MAYLAILRNWVGLINPAGKPTNQVKSKPHLAEVNIAHYCFGIISLFLKTSFLQSRFHGSLHRWTTLSLWSPSSSITLLSMKTSTLSARLTPTTFPSEVKETSLLDECLSSCGSTTRLTLFSPSWKLHSLQQRTYTERIAAFTPFVRFVYNPSDLGIVCPVVCDETRQA